MATRGSVLAFMGLLGGAAGGFLVAEQLSRRSDTMKFWAAVAGSFGGVVGAHLLNTRLLPAEAPVASATEGLGDVPSGFMELGQPPSVGWEPSFVRGTLVGFKDWDAYIWGPYYAGQASLPLTTAQAEAHFRKYPRWTLYGGPTDYRYAVGITEWLKKWALENNMRYLPDPTAQIVPSSHYSPGWPHTDYRWHQYGEVGRPRTVWLGTQNARFGWHYG